MRVTIIVPVLNEAPILADFLRHLRERAPGCEIIVADGKSEDASLGIARDLADQCLQSARNRAVQMNAAARMAGGNVLWFVHADSAVARGSVEAIERALTNEQIVGGCFRLQIDSSRWVYRVRDAVGNLLVDLFALPLGDRGLFCRGDVFFSVGGYPEIALLEDAGFCRRLKQAGSVIQLHETIKTSARRYEELGPVTTMLFYGLIMVLYVLSVPQHMLEGMVRAYMTRRTPNAVTTGRSLVTPLPNRIR